MSRYWFFASNPARYHWDTLFVKGKELWTALRGASAQRYLRQVRKSDKVICYHGAPDRLVYALAQATCDAYLDARHAGRQRNYIVDLKAVQRLPRAVPLKELKLNRALRRMKFLSQPGLAVSPLTEAEYHEILRLAGIVLTPVLSASFPGGRR